MERQGIKPFSPPFTWDTSFHPTAAVWGSAVPLPRSKRREEASSELARIVALLRKVPLQLFDFNESGIGKFC